jgi:hypothetical protein
MIPTQSTDTVSDTFVSTPIPATNGPTNNTPVPNTLTLNPSWWGKLTRLVRLDLKNDEFYWSALKLLLLGVIVVLASITMLTIVTSIISLLDCFVGIVFDNWFWTLLVVAIISITIYLVLEEFGAFFLVAFLLGFPLVIHSMIYTIGYEQLGIFQQDFILYQLKLINPRCYW